MNTYTKSYKTRENIIMFFKILFFVVKWIIIIALGLIYLIFKLVNDLANR